jgi:hypothetical protein
VCYKTSLRDVVEAVAGPNLTGNRTNQAVERLSEQIGQIGCTLWRSTPEVHQVQTMNRLNRANLLIALITFSCLGARLVLATQIQLTVDATSQPAGPARARGPFPGSNSAGHSAGLPIRLELLVPTSQLSPEGTMLVDFLITNVSAKPIRLPSALRQTSANTEKPVSVMTLWLTSDAVRPQYLVDQQTGRLFQAEVVVTSAELHSHDDDAQSSVALLPGTSMLVHASSRVQLKPGSHSITAHAELLTISKGASQLVGTADAEAVSKTLSKATP